MGGMDRYYQRQKEKANKTQTHSGGGLDKFYQRQYYNSIDTSGVDQKYRDTFFTDAKNFLSSAEKDLGSVGWGNASSSFDSLNTSWGDLSTRADTIGAWLYKNKGNIKEEDYNNLYKTLDDFRTSGSSVLDSFKGARDYYAQWESEDAYNNWYAEEQRKEAEKNAVLGAADFEQYFNKGNEYSEAPSFLDKLTGNTGYNSIAEMRNDPNALKIYEDSAKSANGGSWGTPERQLTNQIEYKAAKWMTDDEFKVYNYYYAKDRENGTDTATQFLNSIEETLNLRAADEKFADLQGNTLKEIFYGFAAGLDQFESGIINLGNMITGDSALATPTQITAGKVREDLADNGPEIFGSSLGQAGYDFVSTTANMLPSILVGSFTGGLGGALTLGASATGNAYNEMRNLGYDEWQSRGYGLLVGASETALSYALGGISKLGGKISGNVVSKLVSKIDNALAKTAITLGGNMLSEGLEESIQTVLEPAFKALMTGEDFESPEWDEILYSGLLGALSAGMMEGAPTIAGKVASDIQTAQKYSGKLDKTYTVDGKTFATNQTKAERQALQKELQQGLVSESLEINPESAYAQKMQGRLDKGKTLSGNQLNSLIGANESTLVAQDKGKIKSATEARLTEYGETGDPSKIADIITKKIVGEKISRAEQNILDGSNYAEVVMAELDPNNEGARASSSGWMKSIGTQRISTEAYNTGLNTESVDTPNTQERLGGGKIPLKYQLANLLKADGTVAKAAATPLATPTAEGKAATEPVFKTSESGKTMLIPADGETEAREVSIKEIASINNGEITLRLEDGSLVGAKDVELGSDAEGLLYENVVHMGLNPATANAFVKGFNPSEGLSAEMYAQGFAEAYRYGTYGIPMSEMSRDGFSAELTEAQRTLAYNLGKTDAKYKFAPKKAESAKEVSAEEAKEAPKGAKKGKLHNKLKPTNETQRASLKALGVVAEALGIDIYTYESEVDAKGNRVGANGRFDKKDNSIHIDLFAGRNGKGTMLFTAAHELTHFIRKWSPDKFKTFADFLFEKYGEKGVSVDELIEQKIPKVKKRHKGIDEDTAYDIAYEEVVADACEAMLTDSNALEKIAELKAKDKSLWEKIKEFITKLVERIKAAYEGLDPDSTEANLVREMKEAAEKLQALWTEALMDAGENYQSIGARNMADFAEAKNENGEQLFQYRAMEADEDTYKDMLKKWGKMTDAQIGNLFTTIDKAMDIIQDNLEALDYAWEADIDDRAFSPVKPNSDKLYQVSLDYSTLCRKRILQQTVQAQLQEALNKPLSREEGIAIRDALIALQKEGRQIEVACALCYVESARMKSPEQIKRFTENREQVIKEYFAGKSGGSIKEKIKQAETDTREKLHKETPDGILGKDGTTMLDPRTAALKQLPSKYAEEIREAKREARSSYKPTAKEQEIIDTAMGMTVADFTSPEGLENLAKHHPELFDAYTSYVRNATKSKGIENDTWWRAGDSAQIGDTLIANMNKENGLRSQSWSDFQVIHILDYIASTIELATRETKEQAYTKVPDYAELMGKTGVMINLSLIPTAKFEGKLDYDSVEGMDYKRSLELRDKYHDTVGTICIGIDNKQIQMLLADSTIDYVIPYHKSGMSAAIRKLMHIPTWSQYESYQSEKNLSRADAEAQAKKYGVKLLNASDPDYQKGTSFSEWFDIKEAQQIARMENANPTDKAKKKKYGVMYGGYMAMQNAAGNYLKLCAERGIAPKFSHEKADFTIEENYWKLLIDRKMVDNVTGEVIEQRTIKPIFDEGEVLRILNDELERSPKVKADQDYATRKVTEAYLSGELKGGMSASDIAKIMQKPVDNVTTTNIIASAEDVMYSDRDSSGKELSAEQQEFFKDSKVRDENGNLMVVYHGTNQGDFNTFLWDKTQRADGGFFGRGHYFTSSKGMADLYGKRVIEAYLNIKNPFVWDEQILTYDGEKPDNLVARNIISRINMAKVFPGIFSNNTMTGFKYNSESGEYEEATIKWSNLEKEINDVKDRLILRQYYDGRYKWFTEGRFWEEEVGESFDTQEDAEKGKFVSAIHAFLRKYEGIERDMSFDDQTTYTQQHGTEITEELKKFGYDGAMQTKGGDEIVAFESNQIKRTDNANPTDNPDIRYSDREVTPITEAETKDLEKHFGTTGNFKVAGYLLTDGKLLDFSGKHWGDTTSRSRQVDHRDVSEVLGRGNNGVDDMVDMIGSGNIRLMPEIGGINLAVYPNEKQRRALSTYINYMLATEGQVIIDYDAPGGDTVYSKEYGKYATSRQILADIRNYFNGARQSDLMQFHTTYSERDTDSMSTRSLLAGALESVAQNDIEREKLAQYKGKIDLIGAEQKKLSDLRAKIKELSFAKGHKDVAKIKKLQLEAKQTENRINTYDRQLLNLEATAPLKSVLAREKALARKRGEAEGKKALEAYKERAAKTQRELMNRYQESRKAGIESRNKTAVRHKIKNVVDELNQYLLKGTQSKHVPIELQKAVAEALDAVNMDTVNVEERIAEKRAEMLRAKVPETIERLAKEIETIREQGGNMAKKISRLKTAYDSIINSDDPLIANSHDDVISSSIDKVLEIVKETPLRDMSLYQLEAVYDMYKMVLHSIREANKAFKAKKSEEISVIANRVLSEMDGLKKKKKLQTKAGQAIAEFDWNNQKPIYAFERIGSGTFTEVFENVRAGEDTWAADMSDAQAFREEQYKKHGYAKWDFNKKHKFTSATGNDFELTLGQIMSLYAYSKRGEQATEHLRKGGFVFDGLTEVKEKTKLGTTKTLQLKDATAYNLSEETLGKIISELTPEQTAFADAMQTYLSDVMGERGNEVSLELYGVKLFKEKNYFPLKSATQFMAKAKEQAQGETKIKNKGFTKETNPKANNPIVLTPFMDVWAGHVNEMSMYHAFTLAMEDFYRVFNYKTPAADNMESVSVVSFLENAHGEAATKYIDQLLKDLNGGARSDARENIAKKAMSNFKKASVMASLSVVIQQPSAIVRAQALVDAKHFLGKKVSKAKHKELWAEVKKYAPVAIIKEMGYFDVGMGKSSTEWLKGEKTLGDKMNDILSYAPAKADEYTWCAIWQAVKRETLRKNPKLNPTTEEFLKMAGERFTEVIAKTQVYDSTLSRSANMRSKSGLMQMWTAFMAEPTTSINMLQEAFNKGKGIKHKARVMGAVYGSVLLNSALVSIIYAMRDDDEDETWWEKYFSRLTTEIIDGINPLTYIPFVKDIWSAAQGFDIERADMTLITSLFDSMQGLINVAGKDTTDMEEDEKKEHGKAVTEAILSIVDNISSLTGIPVKNVRRDIKGIINGITTIMTDAEGRPTTGTSLGDAILGEVQSSTPIWGWFPGKSKGDKVYNAIDKGDTAYTDRLKNTYKDEQSFNTSFANHIQKMYKAGTISKEKAVSVLVSHGGKTEEDAASKVQYWEFKKQYPKYDLSEEAVAKYYSDIEPAGIGADTYYDYCKQKANAKGTDLNGDGKTDSGSKKAEVMNIINSLPISRAQKDALYFANGWAASTLDEAPWH